MNTPRINRFLGEWLDRQTSPDFFKKGLILLNAYDFLDSKADAIPGLIAHKKSPLRQQLDEALASRGYRYLQPHQLRPRRGDRHRPGVPVRHELVRVLPLRR